MTRCQFSSRIALWSREPISKYITQPKLDGIISRQNFEDLRQHIRFSKNDETDRRSLVNEFIDAINEHRASQVIPCELICPDESISRWYGLGGDWIEKGLAHYVALDQKPENGCELRTSACGKSGIFIRSEHVISAEGNSNQDGTAILMAQESLSDWSSLGSRLVELSVRVPSCHLFIQLKLCSIRE